ncbi:MAG: FHA domain-containing protein [Cyanobacteria bacterium CRU_2_1]|nr:FHA domain-containing protein [Cyanobacteria bacterium RU_5_0]NJR58884.1 FHA domain-containing protein [Cyanobacteria bacterium CRU_2_1]
MSNVNPISLSLHHPLTLLRRNPLLSDLLLADCNYDLDEVSTVIEPLLQAPKRCRVTGLYIQAVSRGSTAFLATNLIEDQIAEVTPISSSWLIGRSVACAIPIQHNSVSRRHAVIGHHPYDGFYIADLGSRNGTWVNRRRIVSSERQILQDGDFIQVGILGVEFFVASWGDLPANADETDIGLLDRP